MVANLRLAVDDHHARTFDQPEEIEREFEPEVRAVPGKIIALIHIHSVPFVGHDLIQKSLRLASPLPHPAVWCACGCTENELFDEVDIGLSQPKLLEQGHQTIVRDKQIEEGYGRLLVLPRGARHHARHEHAVEEVRERTVPKIVAKPRNHNAQVILWCDSQLWLQPLKMLDETAGEVRGAHAVEQAGVRSAWRGGWKQEVLTVIFQRVTVEQAGVRSAWRGGGSRMFQQLYFNE